MKGDEDFYRFVDELKRKKNLTNGGEALLYSIEKTEERTKREIIEKAVQWLSDELMFRDYSSGRGRWGYIQSMGSYKSLSEFIKAFKQAMEEDDD